MAATKMTDMKKAVLTIWVSLMAMVGMAQVEPMAKLSGSWTGRLNLGISKLTLVLHLEQTGNEVKVTLDSPDQGAMGIPVTNEFLSDDSVAVSIEKIGLSYRGKLSGGKLNGTFTQNGMSLPLVLTRGEQTGPKRPQHPRPPYPYETEEVCFINETDGATLAGTLTYPVGYDKTAKRKPAVVLMVTGSGQENRDEEIYDHKPFWVIADYLARQGIATLRFDDRATGASTGGEVKNATTEDFMRDASAGLTYLRSLKRFGKVGCLGHSEGGAIAFMLGSRRQTDFIISMAGPGVKGDTLLVAQVNHIMTLSGMPTDMTVETYRHQEEVEQTPWLRWFIDYDPSTDIRKTRCPVLAINGDRDCQVISSQNLPAIRRQLRGSKRNLVKEYAGLNHLFQHCDTGLATEYRQIEETIAPEVLEDMARWILQVTGEKR